jgi:hypothetical protein
MFWPIGLPFKLLGWEFDLGEDAACQNIDRVDPFGFEPFDYFMWGQMIALQCTPCTTLRFREAAGLNGYGLIETTVAGVYPNIEYMENGHNIYYATPNAGGAGGREKKVFLQDTWSPKKSDRGWRYPNKLEVVPAAECDAKDSFTGALFAGSPTFTENGLKSYSKANMQYEAGSPFENFNTNFKAKASGGGLLGVLLDPLSAEANAAVDFSDIAKFKKFNVPVGAFMASKDYFDFSKQYQSGTSGRRESRAEAKCAEYKANHDFHGLPCIQKSPIRHMHSLMSRQDFSPLALGDFFDQFGTHVISSAVFGGKMVNRASWNIADVFTQSWYGMIYTIFTGTVWCDDSTPINGKNSDCGDDSILAHDMQGYTKGSPAWAPGPTPSARIEAWLTAAAVIDSLDNIPLSGALENPEIIEDIELVDIYYALAIALSQDQK